jgi:hypothetical protein
MKTNRLLVIVVLLQLVMLVGQWLEGPKILPSAQAEPFNAGADRQAMLDELKGMNSKLEAITAILNSGNLQVKVQQPDERKESGRGR